MTVLLSLKGFWLQTDDVILSFNYRRFLNVIPRDRKSKCLKNIPSGNHDSRTTYNGRRSWYDSAI